MSLVALLPGLIAFVFTQYEAQKYRDQEIRDLALRSAKNTASELERVIIGVEALLIAVANAPAIERRDEAMCSAYLGRLAKGLPGITGIALADADGTSRCNSRLLDSDNRGYADRPYFRRGMGSDTIVVGEYSVGRLSQRKVLPLARSIKGEDGTRSGVLIAGLDLDWLNEKLLERGVTAGGSVTVADRNGIIIARVPKLDFIGTRIPDGYMRLVNAPEEGTEFALSQDGTPRVLGYVPVSKEPEGLYVSAGLSTEASFAALHRTALEGTLIALSAAVATSSVIWLVGRRLFLTPVQTLTATIDRWRKGDHLVRVREASGSTEIRSLAASLDAMMDEIASAEQQKELLSAELAHRIKNILATVQAIATATFRSKQTVADQLSTFQGRLAALSRTHEVLMRQTWDAADLDDLIRDVVRPLCRDVDEQFSIAGPKVRLPANLALSLTMIFHELCTNALKYGALKSSGHIDVSWTVQHAADQPEIKVVWKESGGPVVAAETISKGFGSRLISRALGGSGHADLRYEPTGVVCELSFEVLTPKPASSHAQHADPAASTQTVHLD